MPPCVSSFTTIEATAGDCHRSYIGPMNPYYQVTAARNLPDISSHNRELSVHGNRVKPVKAMDAMLISQCGGLKAGCLQEHCPYNTRGAYELLPATGGAAAGAPFSVLKDGFIDMSNDGVADCFPMFETLHSHRSTMNEDSLAANELDRIDGTINPMNITVRGDLYASGGWTSQLLNSSVGDGYEETTFSSLSQFGTQLEHLTAESGARWDICDPDLSLYNLGAQEQYMSAESMTMMGSHLALEDRCRISTEPDGTNHEVNALDWNEVRNSCREQAPISNCQYVLNPESYASSNFADFNFTGSSEIAAVNALFCEQSCRDEFRTDPDISSYADRYPVSCDTLMQDQHVREFRSEALKMTYRSNDARVQRRRKGIRDETKDKFLLESKRKGMSYKDIKEKGGFEEAESTLRGRFRALTKPREARVRKPEWTENDISILKQVVKQCLPKTVGGFSIRPIRAPDDRITASRQKLSRVSWKHVAERMATHGCYRFGNATVKKKYYEIMGLTETKDE